MDTQLDQFLINLKYEPKQKYIKCEKIQESDGITVIKAENSDGKCIYLKRIKLIDIKGKNFSNQLFSLKRSFSIDRIKEEEDKYLNETIAFNRHLSTEPYIYNNLLCNGCKYIIHHNKVYKPTMHQQEICIELESSGISLDHMLIEMAKKQEILKREAIYQVTENILKALQYCHSLDIIHCDVKCSNIIFDPRKNVFCLCDFGMARIKPDRHSMLPHSSCVNPNTYQPPEILLNRPFNEKVDIFSLGCMLAGILNWKQTFTNTIDQIPYHQRADFIHDKVSTGHALNYIDDLKLKSFIVSLLSYHFQDRPTSSLALENLLISFF